MITKDKTRDAAKSLEAKIAEVQDELNKFYAEEREKLAHAMWHNRSYQPNGRLTEIPVNDRDLRDKLYRLFQQYTPYESPSAENRRQLECYLAGNAQTFESDRYFGDRLTEAASTKIGEKETFPSGAVRNKVNYRFDLLPVEIMMRLSGDTRYSAIIEELSRYVQEPTERRCFDLIGNLSYSLSKTTPELARLYAEAMCEGASKYGENNWRKGLPPANLHNHALSHLFHIMAGDNTEDHESHLVWNIMMLIYFLSYQPQKQCNRCECIKKPAKKETVEEMMKRLDEEDHLKFIACCSE